MFEVISLEHGDMFMFNGLGHTVVFFSEGQFLMVFESPGIDMAGLGENFGPRPPQQRSLIGSTIHSWVH
jgi:hypothetical protein